MHSLVLLHFALHDVKAEKCGSSEVFRSKVITGGSKVNEETVINCGTTCKLLLLGGNEFLEGRMR